MYNIAFYGSLTIEYHKSIHNKGLHFYRFCLVVGSGDRRRLSPATA